MQSPFAAALKLLRPRAGVILTSLLMAWLGTFSDLLQPMMLKVVFDNAVKSHGSQGWLGALLLAHWQGQSLILAAAIGTVLIAALSSVFGYFESLSGTSAAQWVTHDLRNQVYSRIQRLALTFHDRARTGDLMTRVTGDIDALQSFLTSNLPDAFTAVLRLAGMSIFMFLLDWRFTLIALSVTPVLAFIALRYARRIRKSAREVRRKQGEIASRIQETFSSIRLVKAFAQEDAEERRLSDESLASIDLALRVRKMRARLTPAVDITVALGMALVLWYGGRRVLREELTLGTLYVFMQYLKNMYSPIRELSKMSDQYSKAVAAWERVREVIDAEDIVRDRPHARQAPRFRGQIQFDNVTFEYEPGRRVLHKFNCLIEAGKLTAIVGITGSGKTTLANLILRFYDPAAGAVRIDGRDIREFTQRSLRDRISLVAQESILFRMPLWQNIAYGMPDASRDEIVRAAEMANAAEFIAKLPDGYDTIVGERGVTLSGGQRQRIAIARAIIRNSPILILDEPTSGLDTASEQAVLEALDRLTEGKTTLLIAHRLSAVRRASKIIAMRDGKIVESGTHEELLSKPGMYAELSGMSAPTEV